MLFNYFSFYAGNVSKIVLLWLGLLFPLLNTNTTNLNLSLNSCLIFIFLYINEKEVFKKEFSVKILVIKIKGKSIWIDLIQSFNAKHNYSNCISDDYASDWQFVMSSDFVYSNFGIDGTILTLRLWIFFKSSRNIFRCFCVTSAGMNFLPILFDSFTN